MENSFTVLLLAMTLLTALAFVISEYDILNPVCIVMFLMTVSVFLATTTINRWHLYMSAEASLLIITSMICFAIGGFWADWRIKRNLGAQPIEKENCIFYITTGKIILLSVCILGLGYFQYQEFYAASRALGNTSGPFDFSSMIKAIRPSIENETFKFSRWSSYRLVIAKTGMFCSIFCFFMNLIGANAIKWQRNVKYLLPVVAFIPFVAANTGRELLLTVMLFSLLTGTIIYQIKCGFSVQSRMRTLGFFCLCSGTFFLLFLLLGMLSGKVSIGGRPPYEILAHYMGLSMPAFSAFWDQTFVESPYIGSTTLSDIYKKLGVLGIELPAVRGFLAFVHFNDISTNVYTMMARYIKDFGVIGMYLVMAFIAMTYVAFYDYVRLVSKWYFSVAFYGMIPMTLFFSMNDDRFFTTLLSTTTIYDFAALYFVYKLLVTKKNCGIENKKENRAITVDGNTD